MLRLDDDRHAVGLQRLHQRVGDLAGELLLELRAARVGLDEPRELAQPDDAPVRDVADGGDAVERHEVVLADAVERDVLQDHHLVVARPRSRRSGSSVGSMRRPSNSSAYMRATRSGVPSRPSRAGILADGLDDLSHGALNPLQVNGPGQLRNVAYLFDSHC